VFTPNALVERQKFLGVLSQGRHLARTDLKWLCHNVLDFPDVDEAFHRPVFRHLVQFQEVQGTDDLSNYPSCSYTPLDKDPAKVLPLSPRRRILLDPRGHLKTTINIIAHTVQVILNFPDITMFIVHSKLESAIDLCIAPIKRIFRDNARMRFLFPEFCAPRLKSGRYDDMGNRDELRSPARKYFTTSSTIEAGSATTSTAGHHYHWIKFTDIVDEQNWQNEDMRQKIADTCSMFQHLLVSPDYFFEYEGTCYHYDDAYNRAITRLGEAELDKQRYKVFVRGCFKKRPPAGMHEEFVAAEREWPYALDAKGKRISRWPQRFSLESLEAEEAENEHQFRCQKENNPVPGESAAFPVGRMHWISAADLEKVQFQYYELTVDTAETITKRADFTAMVVCGTDKNNRRFVVDAIQDKILGGATVEWMVKLYRKWGCRTCKWEESSYNRGLLTTLQRQLTETGIKMHLQWMKRSGTGESKKMRILTHNPFFRDGTLWFSRGLDVYIQKQLESQYSRFPSGSHDDLIEAVGDHFADLKWMEPVVKSHTDHKKIMADHARRKMFEMRQFENVFGAGDGFSDLTRRGSENRLGMLNG